MNTPVLKKITEETLIPLGIVLIILGGVSWLTTLHSDVQAMTREIREVKIIQFEYTKHLAEINTRLSRIEGHVGSLAKK